MTVQEPPKENLLDTVCKAIKASAASIESQATGASLATELFFSFFKTPYQIRTEKWQQDVTDALNKLQKEGNDLEKLKNNEEFLDILFQSFSIGLKHYQQEKRQALKNAIYHSACDNAPEPSLQQTFLNCIDVFTILHINILMLFSNPEKWFKKNEKALPGMGGISSLGKILESAFPELQGQDEFVNYIWTDLYNKGFISGDKLLLRSSTTIHDALRKRTTILGEQFINFISD